MEYDFTDIEENKGTLVQKAKSVCFACYGTNMQKSSVPKAKKK